MLAPQNKSFFAVEGNIGAGKSTFLRVINKYLNTKVIYEPHQKWQNVSGENILDYFYKDPKRWSYTFQTYAYITRLLVLESNMQDDYPFYIAERSIYSDRYCFAKNLYEMGSMNSLEWKLYKDLFNSLSKEININPKGFIYLRTSPEVCYERLLKRNRSEETNVSIDYIKLLNDKHESWLINKQDVSDDIKNIPVLILDSDEDFEEDTKHAKELINQVIAFINKIEEISTPLILKKNYYTISNTIS